MTTLSAHNEDSQEPKDCFSCSKHNFVMYAGQPKNGFHDILLSVQWSMFFKDSIGPSASCWIMLVQYTVNMQTRTGSMSGCIPQIDTVRPLDQALSAKLYSSSFNLFFVLFNFENDKKN